jgi:2-amino-4-hydroxy-6-hydroxymethyldihydropteridine diphosphokinase
VGERLEHLRSARDRIDALDGVRVLAASSVYETEPQDGAVGQGDFLNAVVAVETELEPEELLDACKQVERALGRAQGGARHAPRPIDVDVLMLGDLEHRSERLTLPHPDLALRRFVLAPLLELEPELALPDGSTLAPRLAALIGQRVERVAAL